MKKKGKVAQSAQKPKVKKKPTDPKEIYQIQEEVDDEEEPHILQSSKRKLITQFSHEQLNYCVANRKLN